jgi:hypothetical protein
MRIKSREHHRTPGRWCEAYERRYSARFWSAPLLRRFLGGFDSNRWSTARIRALRERTHDSALWSDPAPRANLSYSRRKADFRIDYNGKELIQFQNPNDV